MQKAMGRGFGMVDKRFLPENGRSGGECQYKFRIRLGALFASHVQRFYAGNPAGDGRKCEVETPHRLCFRRLMYDLASDYDYPLPDELIARHPPAQRTDARLMVLDRQRDTIVHSTIADLPHWLRPNDCLVLNNTRVIPARLLGTRSATGGRWEGLYLDSPDTGKWRLLCQTRGRLQSGERIAIHRAHAPDCTDRLELILESKEESGVWTAHPVVDISPLEALERFGTVPLPPYMQRDLADETDLLRYQTTYARYPGSVAAPTAGLHFTPELLERCRQGGVAQAFVTLHVGVGTFRPISVEKLSEHRLHKEWCELPQETVSTLSATRAAGGRIIAVGTTTTRTLETAAGDSSAIQDSEAMANVNAAPELPIEPWQGLADLFIRPPYHFRVIDCLMTNFHLPRSSLLVLVAALAGRDFVLRAYAEAVRERYRFFSYGDAMLIV